MKKLLLIAFCVVSLNSCDCKEDEYLTYTQDLTNADLALIPYKQKDTVFFTDKTNHLYYLVCTSRLDTQSTSKGSPEKFFGWFCGGNGYYTTSYTGHYVTAELSGSILNANCGKPIDFTFQLSTLVNKDIRSFNIYSKKPTCYSANNQDPYLETFFAYYNLTTTGKLYASLVNYNTDIPFLDSLQVNGKTYHNVYYRQPTTGYSSTSFIDTLFTNNEAGLIKFTTRDGNYFNLVK